MHRHEKHAKMTVHDDGSYERICTKCGKVLFKRPPMLNQRKDLIDTD